MAHRGRFVRRCGAAISLSLASLASACIFDFPFDCQVALTRSRPADAVALAEKPDHSWVATAVGTLDAEMGSSADDAAVECENRVTGHVAAATLAQFPGWIVSCTCTRSSGTSGPLGPSGR